MHSFPATDWKIHLTPDRVLLDVRSPGEFRQGHIPGALSFPLFTDEERKQVGTAYKQQGPDQAFILGLKLVGPKMAGFVLSAKRLAPEGRTAMYCWRGGGRSAGMAWLLRQAGFDVLVLQGGYKAWRTQALESFKKAQKFHFKVLGGFTGSGKTAVLHALAEMGAQVIDLEALANHRGSAFGQCGDQPTVEQFENELYLSLEQLDHERVIWLEDESRSIGRVFIPNDLWHHMREAPLYELRIPEEERLQNIVSEYGKAPVEQLRAIFMRLEKKLGGQHLKAALDALNADDLHAAARVALRYYDKTYAHLLALRDPAKVAALEFSTFDPFGMAKMLLQVP